MYSSRFFKRCRLCCTITLISWVESCLLILWRSVQRYKSARLLPYQTPQQLLCSNLSSLFSRKWQLKMVKTIPLKLRRSWPLTLHAAGNPNRSTTTKSVPVENTSIEIGIAAYDALQVITSFSGFVTWSLIRCFRFLVIFVISWKAKSSISSRSRDFLQFLFWSLLRVSWSTISNCSEATQNSCTCYGIDLCH